MPLQERTVAKQQLKTARYAGGIKGLNKKFMVEEDEAKVVGMIFEKYVEGTSHIEICRYLNGMGIRTSKGNAFTKNSISRIIRNEKYIGIYAYKDIRSEGMIPAIVSEELFHAAQREYKKRNGRQEANAQRADYILSGTLICGYCGRKMIGISGTGRRGKKFYYYYCPVARRKEGCQKKHIPKEKIERIIIETVVQHMLRTEAEAPMDEKYNEQKIAEQKSKEMQAYFRRRIRETEKAIGNMLRMIEKGTETVSIPERMKELEGELKQLRKAEAEAEEKAHESNNAGSKPPPKTEEERREYGKRVLKKHVMQVELYDEEGIIAYNTDSEEKGEIPLEEIHIKKPICLLK